MNNVYCIAPESCEGTGNNIEYANNVWYYGYSSGGFNVLTSYITGNVYCGSNFACYRSTFEYIDGDVGILAKGYQVMLEATIRDIPNNLYAIGYQALFLGSVTNVTHVCMYMIYVFNPFWFFFCFELFNIFFYRLAFGVCFFVFFLLIHSGP